MVHYIMRDSINAMLEQVKDTTLLLNYGQIDRATPGLLMAQFGILGKPSWPPL
jgi:hypothetical protein